MSYLALYRKYRPVSFDDLVGQSEIATIIKNEILQNKISHAYLFSGPRGTGKTSTAKIIARMINCENLGTNAVPCGSCPSCINFNSSSDIIEIDAASNNGVDEIRELRDKVNLVPTYGKYKVYIIDEVHMLTTQAFNALLKTLEEPPAHVVFILATTEFYKIPATVISRCQKFQFSKFNTEDIVNRLRNISVNENILVGDDVLGEIARLSDGGLRDAINMLDQLSSFKSEKLEVEDVYQLNGVISYVEIYQLLKNISVNDVVSIMNFLDNLDKNGKNYNRFIDELIEFLKEILIYQSTNILSSGIEQKEIFIKELSNVYSSDDLYYFIFSLNDFVFQLKNSSFSKILLITEFIKLSKYFQHDVVENKIEKVKDVEKKDDEVFLKHDDSVVSSPKTFGINDKQKMIRINNAFASASKSLKEKFCNQWEEVDKIASNDFNYVSIAGMIKDIDVLVVGEKNVIFLAKYDSLVDRLFENIQLIEKLLCDVFHNTYQVVFLVQDEWDYERKKYIDNVKAGKVYSYIEEDSREGDDNHTSIFDSDVQKIVSLLGEDVISYQ